MHTRCAELKEENVDIQTCPRRMLEMGPWDRSEGQDSWIERPRSANEVAPTCSFCGSLHPGKFLELVAQGWNVGPTDKNYKAYLHPARPASAQEKKPGQPVAEVDGQVRGKFYYQHLSPSQQQQFIDLYNQGVMQIAYPGYFYVVPFFIRLDPHPEG